MSTVPTTADSAGPAAADSWASRLMRATVALLVIAAALPFLLISVSLIARLPGSIWPLDFATITSVRDAAWEVPEYPGATIEKPRLENPNGKQWFGFLPPDVAVETQYTLDGPVSAQALTEFHQAQLPRFGWRFVRLDRGGDGTRAEFRRNVMALIVTVPASSPAEAVDRYSVRVGPADGKTFRQR